jgi:hypothetical protein
MVLSCDKQGFFVVCDECKEFEPVNISLNVKIDSFGATGFNCIVKVYEGNLEDSLLLATYWGDKSPISVPATINKKYTITATYRYFGSTYISVNSTTPKVRYETDFCEKPCYYVYNRNVNLKLKYL